ncbi:unnamed protein product [Oikopleura dioica]|uniref:DUF962 domain-containing protein n=1 Tax=Oikopleura dioica TaxID=34765 RepID=E4XJV5_OIKDI|nr:unnamed protein product [Oikopleura dioica]
MGIIDFYSGYGAYHHNIVNKWIHIICIPLILYSFCGMADYYKVEISGFEVNIALLIFSFVYIYYMMLHMFAGFITASVSIIVHFYYVLPLIQQGDEATFSHLLAVHIFGWIAQFIGHGVFEGRKPALMDNLLQVFSAPLFVTMEVLFMLGYSPELEVACEKEILRKMPKKK